MVKNEQCVIEAFVRHNIRFLDHLVVLDNGSVDHTRQILLRLSEEFENLILLEDDAFGYTQSEMMTRLLVDYQATYSADYVFALDADEFIDVADDTTIEAVLAHVPRAGYGLIPWCTFVLTPSLEDRLSPDPLRAITARRRQELPGYWKAVVRMDGKDADGLQLEQGNHAVRSTNGCSVPSVRLPGVRLLHYPVRSRDQIIAKSVVGWMAYLAVSPRAGESKKGDQWRSNFDRFMHGTSLDHQALCEMSMLYTQRTRAIDWTHDVVQEGSRLVYERRYSTGEALGATELIARSWEQSVTGSQRHSPSVRIAKVAQEQSSRCKAMQETKSASALAGNESGTAADVVTELIEQGRQAEAIARLDRLILENETAELWNDWAALQCACGEIARAEQGFRRALYLEGSHRQAAVNLGFLLMSQGELDEGRFLVGLHEATLTTEERLALASLCAGAEAPSIELPQLTSTVAAARRRRKYLVVVRAGDTSLHPQWLRGSGERSWDLIVHAFGETCPWVDEEGVEVIRATGAEKQGPKLRAMHALYGRRRSDFLSYDYVFFPDDDLAADLETINLIFVLCQHFKLDYAQPALTHDSHMAGWGITMENRSFLLRYTTFVEVMAPVFSRSFLELCIPTFTENVSGYGLDILWSSWVTSPWKIAILDACPMKHTRPPFQGQLYKTIKEMGASPEGELIALIKRWHLVKEKDQIPGKVVVPTARVLGGVLLDQTRITVKDGHGMQVLRALLNGFPEEIARDHQQSLNLLFPIMQEMLAC